MSRKSTNFLRWLGISLVFTFHSALAAPTVVTVTDAETEGWFAMDQAGAATGEISTTNPHGDGGTGSLEFSTSGDMADIINASRVPLVTVTDIVEVGYDFYSDDATLAPALKLQYWNPQRFGTLVYEPINQGGYTTGSWNTVDGTVGFWWSTEFGQTDLRTLADWQAELGNIPVTFLQIGVGSGWGSAVTVFADMVHLNAGGSDTIWDFEGEDTLPPPPQEVITVDETDLAGWFQLNQAGAASGSLSTNNPHGPGGVGSLEFLTTGDTADQFTIARVPLVRINEITGIGYDYYADVSPFAPALKLEYWNAQRFGTLVYEPSNNGGVTTGAWITEDAAGSGRWWSTEFGGDDIRTFDEWQAELGDILVTFMQVGVGSGWSSATTTNADAVYLMTAGTNMLWDFEGEEEQLPPPAQETVTVDPDNPEGWFAMDQAGAATAALSTTQPHGPGGTGSLEFNTTGDMTDIIHVARIPLMLLTDIQEIGYDFYSDHPTLAPALKVQYWSLQHFGTLVYEPINQGAYPTGSWNTVDGMTGLWWSSEFGQADKRSLADWQLALGDMLINFMQVGVGSGWGETTQTFADLVHVATSGSNTLWDFEGEEELPPPPLELVTVDDENPEGWFAMDQAGAATGELSDEQPRGPGNTGSLKFTTSGDPLDIIHSARIPVVSMSDIRFVGYDFYSDNASVAPTLKLQYWSPTRFGTLVYEPIDQGAYPVDTWVTVDGTMGVWYSTEFGPSDKRSLADWQTELGGILVNFMQVGVGSGWSQAMTGYVDLVQLTTNINNTQWDFESGGALPPEPVEDNATFHVVKYYSDDSTTPVDVTLTCDGGLPLQQAATIAGGDPAGVTFTLTNVTSGAYDCTITESGAPDGYLTVMNGGAGCTFEGVVAGQQYECLIWNVAAFASFTVTHDLVLEGPADDSLPTEIDVDIICQTPIANLDAEYDDATGYWTLSDTLDDGESLTATLLTVTGPAYCMAQGSSPHSAVSLMDDCDGREITAGTDDECTITSSAFFEGIPTLGQKGMALLILLMFGAGMVAVRRLA